MLAVYFERMDNDDQFVSYHAVANTHYASGPRISYDGVDGYDGDPVLQAGGGFAQVSDIAGQVIQERSGLASNLTGFGAFVFVPTVVAAYQVAAVVDGNANFWAFTGSGVDPQLAIGGGLFQLVNDDFLLEPGATFTFHGTMLLAAYGSDSVGGSGGGQLSMEVRASAGGQYVTATIFDGISTSDPADETWQANSNIPGESGDLGSHTLEKYVDFEITGLTHGSNVDLEVRIHDENDFGAGGLFSGTAISNWDIVSAIWGYATKDGSGGGPPGGPGGGDVNGDGEVNIDDYELWEQGWRGEGIIGRPTYVQGDLNRDGVVDEADLAEIANAMVSSGTQNVYIVSSSGDGVDANRTFGNLTLREALAMSSASAGSNDLILFAPSVSSIGLSGSELSVAADVEIRGPGASQLTIDAGGASRVFKVNAGVGATISGLTVTDGGSVSTGGGILNNGSLTLDSVVVSGNTTTAGGYGGGILTQNGLTGNASLWLTNSTVDGNHAAVGSGLYLSVGGGDVEIAGSTISNNVGLGLGASTYSAGGGLAADSTNTGSIEIKNSTFSGNQALYSGAIRLQNSLAPFTMVNSTVAYNIGDESGGLQRLNNTSDPVLHNTIISENKEYTTSAKKDIYGSVDATNSTFNLIGSGGAGGLVNNTNNNIVLTSLQNAGLAPLGDYGGKTKTHALLTASLAVDKGSNDVALAYDQRGLPREFNLPLNANGSDGYRDIGAFEANNSLVLTVRVDYDRSNAISYVEDLSIREALYLSRQLAGVERIEFAPELFDSGPLTITLGATLGSSHDFALVGPGPDKLIFDGDGNQVFIVGGAVTLEGFTVTGGEADFGGGILSGGSVTLRDLVVEANESTDLGGGIYNVGSLTLDGVRVVGNIAVNGGGGVYSTGNLTVLNSEVSDNSLTQWFGNGGGIYHSRDLGGSIAILNSTISGNTAVSGGGGYGGGVYIGLTDGDYDATDAVIINSTISANGADFGSGLYTDQLMGVARPVLVHNTIIVDNAWDVDIEGLALDASSSHNLVRAGYDGGLSGLGNIILSSLDSSGVKDLDYYRTNKIRTHALTVDSPAVDAADDAIALLWGLTEDQRGFDRSVDYWTGDDLTDIGALELLFIEEYWS
ncbi:right-handed parallel beta-helix repeat-containing protein [Lacipirellula parvula]|nr:right-handed parallel beta-helix repeat-containing protein [Lacipirellula parvula]